MFERLRARRQKPRTYRTKQKHSGIVTALNVSQVGVPGYSQVAWQDCAVLVVGAGALGSWTVDGCAKKAVGHIGNCDHDQVELKNLTRQAFTHNDLGAFKVFATAWRVTRQKLFPLQVDAYPYSFAETLNLIDVSRYTAIAVLPDNDEARKEAAEIGIIHGIPVVGAGLSEDARSLYVAIQRPGAACLGCIRPTIADDQGQTTRCGIPGSVDSVWVAVGFVLFALEQIVCGNELRWNYRTAYLTGARPDHCSLVKANPECSLCGPQGSDKRSREREDSL